MYAGVFFISVSYSAIDHYGISLPNFPSAYHLSISFPFLLSLPHSFSLILSLSLSLLRSSCLSSPPLILLLQRIAPFAKNKPRQINHMQSSAIYLQYLIKSCDLQPRRSTSREPLGTGWAPPAGAAPARHADARQDKMDGIRDNVICGYAEADSRRFPSLTYITTNSRYPFIHLSFHPFMHTCTDRQKDRLIDKNKEIGRQTYR